MDTEIMLPYEDFDIKSITILNYTEEGIHAIVVFDKDGSMV